MQIGRNVSRVDFSDKGENILGKGEIPHYEQFLLFPKCFQRPSKVEASKCICKWINYWLYVSYFMSRFYVVLLNNSQVLTTLTLSQTSPAFYVSTVQVF